MFDKFSKQEKLYWEKYHQDISQYMFHYKDRYLCDSYHRKMLMSKLHKQLDRQDINFHWLLPFLKGIEINIALGKGMLSWCNLYMCCNLCNLYKEKHKHCISHLHYRKVMGKFVDNLINTDNILSHSFDNCEHSHLRTVSMDLYILDKNKCCYLRSIH